MSSLSRDEQIKVVERMKETWPREEALALIDMEPGERDVIAELVLHLDARPVDADGYPLKRRGS